MRNTNRKRALVVSSAVILLCMTLILGTTWALFTDTQTVKNHLQAGDLKISLARTRLEKTTLDEKGYLVEKDPITSRLDFRNPTDENVFGLEVDDEGNLEKVVPGSKFVATMEIGNESDVAFGYWVKIVCDDADVAKTLAQQLIITVYTDKSGDGKVEMIDADKSESTVAVGLDVGADQEAKRIGHLGIGEKETFIVSVEFDDLSYEYKDGKLTSKNDPAQENTVNFDLIVYAVQEKDAPATTTTP